MESTINIYLDPGCEEPAYFPNPALTFLKYCRPVVFLQHGLFGSSHQWVWNGPEEDLGLKFEILKFLKIFFFQLITLF